jgi:hypothetical protein
VFVCPNPTTEEETQMLSTAQVHEFRTFGFIVLRDYLAEHTAPLRVEVDTALRDAYRSTYDERTSTASSAITCRWRPR